MQRILLVKTSSLGDVIHNLPVVNDILTHFPNAQIDWVVEESFADIPRLHPKVNNVITVAFRQWRKWLFGNAKWQQIFSGHISTNHYDLVIDTQGLLKSALITRQAKGVKHGYDKHSIRESLASWFYDKKYAISYDQHAVLRNRALVAMSLGYQVPSNAPDYGIIAPLSSISLPSRFVIGLHGTSRESKQWPIDHWITLGKALNQSGLSLVLPWVTSAEYDRAMTIHHEVGKSLVLPKLNIHELAGVIGKAEAAIGVDTGLSHLAVALSKPTVAIYTDTNPALTGVMAGTSQNAINLGGIGQIPSVDEVTSALTHLCLHSKK